MASHRVTPVEIQIMPWARQASVEVGCISKPGVAGSDYRQLGAPEVGYATFAPDYEAAQAINLWGGLYIRMDLGMQNAVMAKIQEKYGDQIDSVSGFSLKKIFRKVGKAVKKVVPKFVRKAVSKVTKWKPIAWTLKKAKQFAKWVDKATQHPVFTGIVFAITQAIPGAQAAGYAFLALQALRALLAKMSTEKGASAAEIAQGVAQIGMMANKASGGDMFAQAVTGAYQAASKAGVKPEDIDKLLKDFPDKGAAIKAAGGAVAASISQGETNPEALLKRAAGGAASSALQSVKSAAGSALQSVKGAAGNAIQNVARGMPRPPIPAEFASLFAR